MAQPIVVRDVCPPDIDALAGIRLSAWREAYAKILPAPYLAGLDEAEERTLWAGRLERALPYFVAIVDGEVAGYAIVGRCQEASADADGELEAIYVHPRFHGRGIGKVLLREAARRLSEQNFACAALFAFRDNHRALEFYRRFGAEFVDEGSYEIAGNRVPDVCYRFPSVPAMREALGAGKEIVVRPLMASDDIIELTELLHRSYRRNAEANLHFGATHQPPERIRERLEEGKTWVATQTDRIVGTLRLIYPEEIPYGGYAPSHPIASFGLFAVDPDLQGLRLGPHLLAVAEAAARREGAKELCLDTAKPASGLINYYQRLGFRIVGEADWRPDVNYESWIMAKPLEATGL